MRSHPERGRRIVSRVSFLRPALPVVSHHHERWDGGGYPKGSAGEEIPTEARIFSVVDTYDAITSERPYRAGRTHAEALAELRRAAGTQLDPDLVRAFCSLPVSLLRKAAAAADSPARCSGIYLGAAELRKGGVGSESDRSRLTA